MSISVSSEVYGHFWSLVFWRGVNITECMKPYYEHNAERFFQLYFIFVTFLRF